MEIIKDWKNQLIRPHLQLVLSSNGEAGAQCLAFAREHGIATAVVERGEGESKKAFETRILAVLEQHGIDYIYLAGFMHILGPTLLGPYSDKVVNVHPSLLPAFKGLHGIQQAMDAGVKVTGATTHFVDQTLDGGKIIDQKVIEIREDDTFEQIDNRLFKITTLITLETINSVFK
jgi:phosphoribosylglycinamide formyltransferase-1